MLRFLGFAAAAGLAALVAWAIDAGSFSEAGGWLTSDPWGVVTLSDLYLGLAISAGFILAIERDWRVALIWILPLPALGNIWTALWIAVRARRIWQRLHAARE